jgi:Cytochrome C oxidase, cbb3-type, subunit III
MALRSAAVRRPVFLAPARALFFTAATAAAAAFGLGCNRPPSADSIPEWTPADHRSSDDEKLAGRGTPGPRQPRSAGGGGTDVAQLVDLTWRQQCTQCHGPTGRGDGQLAPMTHPPDLTDARWQSGVTDADMLAVLKNGKNRMPKFDLPAPVLDGLVARVRSFRGR